MALTTGHQPSLAYVGVGKQSVAGTAVAPTKFFRWASMGPIKPLIKSEVYWDGSDVLPTFAARLGVTHEGSFKTWLTADEGFALIAWLLAGTDTTSGSGDPYVHSVPNSKSSKLVTFEYSQGNGLEVTRVTDCLISNVKLSCKAGTLVELDVKFMGRLPVPTTSPATVTFIADRPAIFSDGIITLGSELSSDIAVADIVDLTIDLKNNVEAVFAVGSQSPNALQPNNREIDVAFEVYCQDNKFWRDIYYNSNSGTTLPATLFYLSTFQVKFDAIQAAGNSNDHFVQLLINSLYLQDGVQSFDAKAKAYTVKATAKAVVPSGGGATITASSQSAFATAYI